MGSHSAKHEKQFKEWYAADRSFVQAAAALQVPERTLRFWAEREDWHHRADRIDKQAAKLADKAAVRARAAYLISVAEQACQNLPRNGGTLPKMAANPGFSSQERREKRPGC